MNNSVICTPFLQFNNNTYDTQIHILMTLTYPKQCKSKFQIGNILLVVFPTPIGHFDKPSFMGSPSIETSNNIPAKQMKYRFKKKTIVDIKNR